MDRHLPSFPRSFAPAASEVTRRTTTPLLVATWALPRRRSPGDLVTLFPAYRLSFLRSLESPSMKDKRESEAPSAESSLSPRNYAEIDDEGGV